MSTENNNDNEVYRDIDGKESSKRKMGIRLVNFSMYAVALYFLLSIGLTAFGKEFVYDFPYDVWATLLGVGASLLGLTLVERFGTK